MFFDTHAHYDDDKFNEDRDDIIINAVRSGVDNILNASSDIASSRRSVLLAEKYDFIYASVGVHPHEAIKCDEDTILELFDLAKNKKVVAIGEIGLDYYYDLSPKEVQKKWFARQIDVAKELNLPIIVHDRDAHSDVMDIIKSENAKKVGGIFHCYSGSSEMAKEVLKNNFYISIAGPVTFKNAKRTVEVIESIPLERLLIETDCPYLAPEPHRGTRNDSRYIRHTAQKIADIRGITLDEIADITMKNAKRLFGIIAV